MNCHTCKHNQYHAMFDDDDPDGGMVNSCTLEPGHAADVPDAVDRWIFKQVWDAECMCPAKTTPCPGFKARA